MGAKLKALSGKDIIKILKGFGFIVHDQTGSHIKLRRVMLGMNQTLIVPNHNPIAKGTLKGILNQASKYISQSELLQHFYSK
ncbi:MAG: type II toxin-antitoxin system HicA family toxin [Candidatus Paceibacterota bacterium]|jgi:predicted RNA binding protein YcfA (HicA-like mRNA interferase family)